VWLGWAYRIYIDAIWGRLNAGLGSPWRKANARELREGKALHVSKMIAQVQSALTTFSRKTEDNLPEDQQR